MGDEASKLKRMPDPPQKAVRDARTVAAAAKAAQVTESKVQETRERKAEEERLRKEEEERLWKAEAERKAEALRLQRGAKEERQRMVKMQQKKQKLSPTTLINIAPNSAATSRILLSRAKRMGRKHITIQSDEIKEKWSSKKKRYKRLIIKDEDDDIVDDGKLGTGGFSYVAVYKHKDRHRMNRNVAVKQTELTRHNTETDTKRAERTQRELDIMKTLDHENIIKYLDYYEWAYKKGLTLCIVMELYEGGSLEDYMLEKEGPLSVTNAQKFAVQIKEALLYLKYTAGVTHRDIKPANIMLTNNSENAVLKIIDFGESKYKVRIKGQTAHETLGVGTEFYMAPEQFKEPNLYKYVSRDTTPLYGGAVDLWAFGVILYKMLTNVQLFKVPGEETKEIWEVIQETVPIINYDDIAISESGRNALRGLLNLNPQKRSWDILKHNKWLQGPVSIDGVFEISECSSSNFFTLQLVTFKQNLPNNKGIDKRFIDMVQKHCDESHCDIPEEVRNMILLFLPNRW